MNKEGRRKKKIEKKNIPIKNSQDTLMLGAQATDHGFS